MIRRGILIAAVVLLAFPASAVAGPKRADAKLERALDGFVRLADAPAGISAVVQREGKPRFHTAGVADRAAPGPFRLDDHLRVASITKAFTAAVVLKLADQRRLSLDATIGETLPELPAQWHAVTARQLLSHTSGVPSFTASPEYLEYLSENFASYVTPYELLGFIADDPLEFTPGTSYEYSNSGAIILGLMVERTTGTAYGELLQRLVFGPLRLRASSLPTTLLLPDPYIRGYQFDGPGQPQEEVSAVINPSQVWAAGGVISTPRDLNTFVRAWAGGGFLKSRGIRRQQTAFQPPFSGGEPIGPGINRAGLGLYRYKVPCGVVLGHSGNFPGYTNWIAATADGSRSVVVNTNLQMNIPDQAQPATASALRRVFRRAACAALAGS